MLRVFGGQLDVVFWPSLLVRHWPFDFFISFFPVVGISLIRDLRQSVVCIYVCVVVCRAFSESVSDVSPSGYW